MLPPPKKRQKKQKRKRTKFMIFKEKILVHQRKSDIMCVMWNESAPDIHSPMQGSLAKFSGEV